jgi:serine phosphatase RsbU (regulator of sigma subunit)
MGQLRCMLRGIAAVDDTGPAQLLTKLDGAITQLQLHTLATVALARFEQTPEEIDRGVTRMRWANAGHPSPLVIHPDGSLAALASWHGELMLGVDPTTTRTESVVTLDRGTTVLLYTDGLVERRTSDLDDGQRRLREAASELAHLSLDELCDQLVARLVEDDHDDDVALVAIRLHRQDRPRPDEAGPQNVPPTVPADQAPSP